MVLTSIRNLRAAFAIALLLIAALGCSSSNKSERFDPASLESVFPGLVKLKVTVFRDQDWCRNLAYMRGSYSDTQFHSTCDLFSSAPLKFDAIALADLRDLRRTFAEVGISPSYAEITYSKGAVDTAVFEVGCAGCALGRFIYDMGGARVKTDFGPGASQVVLSPNWVWYEER